MTIRGVSSGASEGRRRSAQQRFRQGFLHQASERLRDFAQLLDEAPEARESVAFELRRLSETATSLHLSTIARATELAADELERVGGPPERQIDDTVSVPLHPAPEGARVLRRVANAIRHTVGRLRFGPMVLVGVAGEQAQQLRQDAEIVCEPVHLFHDLRAFAAGLHTEQPSCVVLPVQALDAVRQLATRERFPVLVHGTASDWEARLAAMEAGAQGFLLHPFRLADVTRLSRWRSHPDRTGAEVLLLADPSQARDDLATAMAHVGLHVVTATDPAELSLALEAGTPRAVVLGPEVKGRPALSLVRIVRGHPRCNHVPLLVYGRPDGAALLRSAGVDDVIRQDAPPGQAAQRVVDRVARFAALPWERDPVSGLAFRLGVLDALDDELARSSRTGEVLSVGLVAVVGLREAVEAYGASAQRDARRHLTELLGEHLRRTDIYGELALGELIVALPGCDRAVATQRIEALGEAFRRRCHRDSQLMELHFIVGVADTQLGLAGVAQRAEQELRARRL